MNNNNNERTVENSDAENELDLNDTMDVENENQVQQDEQSAPESVSEDEYDEEMDDGSYFTEDEEYMQDEYTDEEDENAEENWDEGDDDYDEHDRSILASLGELRHVLDGSENDDANDERTFREIFEEKFGTEHPEFFAGTFFEAAELAHQRSTFVVVYTDRKSFPDYRSQQHFLTRPHIIQFLNEKNAILWAALSSSEEAKQFKDIYNVRVEIFLGMYMENNQSEIVLAKEIYLPDTHENILLELHNGEVEHIAKMLEFKKAEKQRLERQRIIAEQDRAYEESLRIDRAKSERKLAAEKARLAQEAAKELQLARITAKKEEARENLKPEPNEDCDSSEVITLAFRFPSGTKTTRKFLVSHTLADLHYFVFTLPEIDCADIELKTNFPNKVLDFDPETRIGASSLRNRDLVMVYVIRD